jgi:hypothetical protein
MTRIKSNPGQRSLDTPISLTTALVIILIAVVITIGILYFFR